jgi:MFS family permease
MTRPRFLALLLLTFATMLPVTAVVPVLKQLVPDRYGVSLFATSAFMSLNMLGALLAAPVVGWLSDRRGWTRRLLVLGAVADAVLWWALASLPAYPLLVGLRVLEGAAHITVLSMLLTVASRTSAEDGRRTRMGAVGAALLFGVAVGPVLGGLLGAHDPVRPLRLGALVMGAVAAAGALALPALGYRPDPAAHPRWPRLHAPAPLRLPYLFSFVDRLTVGFLVLAFPMLAAGVHGLGPARTGALLGAFMLPFALLNYPAARLGDRLGPWRLVLAGSAGYGAAYAALPWCPTDLLFPLMALCGTCSALMFGPTLVLVVARSTPTTRSSAVAGFNAVGSVGFLVGPLVAGLLLDALGRGVPGATRGAHAVTFAVGGAAQLLAVCWAALRLRGARE